MDNNLININNNLIIQNSGINSEKNEKSVINISNVHAFKQRSVNFTENLTKLLTDMKNKYKINDDPKAIKEFEAFYNNMLDKINPLRNNNGPTNNAIGNPQYQNSLNTNPTQENTTTNVKYFCFNKYFIKN